jgi:hypothetical protein
MMLSTGDNMKTPKKRSTEPGTLVGVRLQIVELKKIDAFIKKQDTPLTRPEAIRRLVELGLSK